MAGLVIRIALLPSEGLRDDTDQFVGWVHHIATNGLGSLYGETAAGPVTFGPVVGYLWWLLAAMSPAFQTATNAADVDVRVLIKLPAAIADFALAAVVVGALRERPTWAVAGAAAILLHPAVIDVSAWWGQYESVYVVSAVAAGVAAGRGNNGWAAALIAVSVLTKPQALPLLIPFAAWFWATDGWRGVLRSVAIGLAVFVVVWLPFLAYGGPAGYLDNLAVYQTEIFAIASLRAWNLWWIFQEVAAGGLFLPDQQQILGPLTMRHIGVLFTVVLEAVIAIAILRNPQPRTLLVGLAAATLVAFSFLTTMHERYAFAALAFLALLLYDRGLRLTAVAFGVVFFLNLVAAIPPFADRAGPVPINGPAGIAGSIAMLAITAASLYQLRVPANSTSLPAP